MTFALIAAVVVAILLLDQAHRRLAAQQERHAAQIDKLLLWRHDPHTASLPEKTDSVLYLAPEDDEAWNKAHGKAD